MAKQVKGVVCGNCDTIVVCKPEDLQDFFECDGCSCVHSNEEEAKQCCQLEADVPEEIPDP